MAKNVCKLCSRRFASPRALAGHMRSHSVARAGAAAAVAAAPRKQEQISSASSASTSFADANNDEEIGVQTSASPYALRENSKRTLPTDAAFSDRESESESESTPPHAKRVDVGAVWGCELEPTSSLSTVSTSEEVALSLMGLSRYSWPSAVLAVDDDSDDGYAPPASPPREPTPTPMAPAEKRTQFECVVCKKVFRSYQALGGHRASNIRAGRSGNCAPPVAGAPLPPLPERRDADEDEDMDAKQKPPRECPHCYRVFRSGQALGAHKRNSACGGAAAPASLAGTGTATASASATSAATPRSPINASPCMIDLNVAPPSEEMEVSDDSDPRFKPGA